MDGLTTAQAAFVVGEPLEAFKKVVERAPIKPHMVQRGRRKVRRYGQADLVFLHAYAELRQAFTPKSQSALYDALQVALQKGHQKEVVFGKHRYDLAQHVLVIETKLKELDALNTQIDTSGKDPVIRDTGIEVYRIAALLDAGETVASVLRDYPSFNEPQVIAAQAFAAVHPKVGRPYPKLTAKSAMRAADLSALDDED
ncbi:DUF433 domain-containing protein [Xanthobacter autotrophicus]|uniref:DUF433 domain-containing protein n=1 Tax=Xanthobacter autotrophicus TaxID=280 RepID=UPI00372CD8AD